LSTATAQPDAPRRPTSARYELQVADNEKVASLLIAVAVLILMVVVGLFIVWLSNQMWGTKVLATVSIERVRGGDREAFGDNNDFEPPGIEEVTDLGPTTVEDQLQIVVDGVGSRAAQLDNPNLDGNNKSGGTGAGGPGDGEGLGDGGEAEGVPISQRWKIRLKPGLSTAQYASQLDFFGIEIAVVGGSQNVTYISNLSQNKPNRAIRPGSQENRYHFSWEKGSPFVQIDATLLARAGVRKTSRQVTVHFYPDDLVLQPKDQDAPRTRLSMEEIEAVAMEKKELTLKDVKRTVFGIRAGGDGYEFYVIELF